MGLSVQTAAAAEALDLQHLKSFMREQDTDEDGVILRLVRAAEYWWENFTGKALIHTTYDETRDYFDDVMVLERSPVSSITQITYIDADGDSQTLSSATYAGKLTQSPGRVELAYNQSWPTTRDQSDAVTIRYVAGYGAAYTSVPEDVRHALEELVLWRYDNRDGSSVPPGVMAVAWQHRIVEFC